MSYQGSKRKFNFADRSVFSSEENPYSYSVRVNLKYAMNSASPNNAIPAIDWSRDTNWFFDSRSRNVFESHSKKCHTPIIGDLHHQLQISCFVTDIISSVHVTMGSKQTFNDQLQRLNRKEARAPLIIRYFDIDCKTLSASCSRPSGTNKWSWKNPDTGFTPMSCCASSVAIRAINPTASNDE